jgi:hypothetical protein
MCVTAQRYDNNNNIPQLLLYMAAAGGFYNENSFIPTKFTLDTIDSHFSFF